MKEIGKEIIEIGGVEYTLFLNRKGIIAWEKYAKKETELVKELKEKADSISYESEIKENTNPFEGLEVVDEMENEKEVVTSLYKKLYWIMLYENHKLSFDNVSDLYNEAIKEYGEEQLISLANQMIEDANKSNISEKEQAELKNLKALRPTK